MLRLGGLLCRPTKHHPAKWLIGTSQQACQWKCKKEAGHRADRCGTLQQRHVESWSSPRDMRKIEALLEAVPFEGHPSDCIRALRVLAAQRHSWSLWNVAAQRLSQSLLSVNALEVSQLHLIELLQVWKQAVDTKLLEEIVGEMIANPLKSRRFALNMEARIVVLCRQFS